jgi:hypothetical protein
MGEILERLLLADLNRSPRHFRHQMSGRFQLERSIQLDLMGRGP